jgi:hypothetical protein
VLDEAIQADDPAQQGLHEPVLGVKARVRAVDEAVNAPVVIAWSSRCGLGLYACTDVVLMMEPRRAGRRPDRGDPGRGIDTQGRSDPFSLETACPRTGYSASLGTDSFQVREAMR